MIVGRAFYLTVKKDKADIKFYDLIFINSKTKYKIDKLICLPLIDGLLFSYYFIDDVFMVFDFLNLVNEYFTVEHIELLVKYKEYYESFNRFYKNYKN